MDSKALVNASTIADFEAGVDKIQLNRKGASFIDGLKSAVNYEGFADLAPGALAASRFQILGSGGNLAPSQAYITYDNATEDLFYDDSYGSTKVATLQGAPTLSASGISIV